MKATLEKNKIWSDAALTELADYVEECSFAITKQLLPEINRSLGQLALSDNENGSVLTDLKHAFMTFGFETEVHFIREKAMLIPYIRELDNYHRNGGSQPDIVLKGIDNPISLMEYERYFAKKSFFKEVRSTLTECRNTQAYSDLIDNILEKLDELEEKMDEYFTLMNEFLLPKAIQTEIFIRGNI